MAPNQVPRKKSSLLDYVLLTLAVACWIWVHWSAPMDELPAIFVMPVTIGIGAGAYLLHRLVWSWRGTVVAAVLLIHVSALTALILSAGGSWAEGREFWGYLVKFQVDAVWWDITHFDLANPGTLFSSVLVFGSLMLAAVHPIRPSFVSAMTSTVGVGLWLQISLAMMAHAA